MLAVILSAAVQVMLWQTCIERTDYTDHELVKCDIQYFGQSQLIGG